MKLASKKWGPALIPTEKIYCIGVDSKVDEKNLHYEDEVENQILQKRVAGPEHHLTFTNKNIEKSICYLTHRNIPLKGATGLRMTTETLAVLREYGSESSLLGILLDNTSVNTGIQNGLVATMVKDLGRNVHMIGCALHQNELPLRAIFEKLDGATTGPQSFSGPIGKLCSEDIHCQSQVKFKKLPYLHDFDLNEVYEDLSSDQELLLQYVTGTVKGSMSSNWSS